VKTDQDILGPACRCSTNDLATLNPKDAFITSDFEKYFLEQKHIHTYCGFRRRLGDCALKRMRCRKGEGTVMGLSQVLLPV